MQISTPVTYVLPLSLSKPAFSPFSNRPHEKKTHLQFLHRIGKNPLKIQIAETLNPNTLSPQMEGIEAENEDRRDPVEMFMSLESWPISPLNDADADSVSPSQSDTFLVGFVIANVVGLRYYQGTISGREIVGLVRDELNPHDENAIKVLNMLSVQVGYIERAAAAVLAPLIDGRLITVEGSSTFFFFNFFFFMTKFCLCFVFHGCMRRVL